MGEVLTVVLTVVQFSIDRAGVVSLRCVDNGRWARVVTGCEFID